MQERCDRGRSALRAPSSLLCVGHAEPHEQKGLTHLKPSWTASCSTRGWITPPSKKSSTWSNKRLPAEANRQRRHPWGRNLGVPRHGSQMPVADNVVSYAVVAASTRLDETAATAEVNQYLSWGAGPRASQYLVVAAKFTRPAGKYGQTSRTSKPWPPPSAPPRHAELQGRSRRRDRRSPRRPFEVMSLGRRLGLATAPRLLRNRAPHRGVSVLDEFALRAVWHDHRLRAAP